MITRFRYSKSPMRSAPVQPFSRLHVFPVGRSYPFNAWKEAYSALPLLSVRITLALIPRAWISFFTLCALHAEDLPHRYSNVRILSSSYCPARPIQNRGRVLQSLRSLKRGDLSLTRVLVSHWARSNRIGSFRACESDRGI